MGILSILGAIPNALVSGVSTLMTNWVNWRISEKDREFERFKFEQEQKLQRELSRRESGNKGNATSIVQYRFEQESKLQRELARAKHEWQTQLIIAQQEHALTMQERELRFKAFCIEQEQKIQRELAAYERETVLLSFKKEEELQKWLFEQQKALQQDLAIYRTRSNLELAAYQRQSVLATEEFKRILEDHPLKISPSELLNDFARYQQNGLTPPLLVLISPPTVEFEPHQDNVEKLPTFEKRLAQRLRDFLQHYEHTEKLIDFRGGAWNTKRISAETAVSKLFAMFSSISTLLLESEIDDDYLHLRIAFWSAGDHSPQHKSVISYFPYLKILNEYARQDAIAWRTDRKALLEQNVTNDDLVKMNEVAEYNQEVLRLDEISQNIGTTSNINYRYDEAHYDRLIDLWSSYNCLIAGWVADIHYFSTMGLPPLLPSLLAEIVGDFPDAGILQSVIEEYPEIYSLLEEDYSHWMPDIYAELAEALIGLDVQQWTQEMIKKFVEKSLQYWIDFRLDTYVHPKDHFNALVKVAGLSSDKGYLRTLQSCYRALGETTKASQLGNILQQWDRKIFEGKIEDHKGVTLLDVWG